METAGHSAAAYEPAVDLKDVVIDYPPLHGTKGVRAINGLTVDIREGERFVILGPSGCGKSTVLHAIGGNLPVASGRLTVSGKSVVRPGLDRIFVFQEFDQLLPWKTVRGNVEFALACKARRTGDRSSKNERREKADHYLDAVNLSKQADQFPHTLSGGQKQRAAIARAFSLAPRILLMDEPFASLDAINRDRMQNLLLELWQAERCTVVFVTHDVAEAGKLADRILVLTEGPGRRRALIDRSASKDESTFVSEVRALL